MDAERNSIIRGLHTSSSNQIKLTLIVRYFEKPQKMNFFPIKSWVSISFLRIWISDAHQLEIFLTFWENAVKVE